MSNKRVVVTGLGLVTPLGLSRTSTWENIIASKSGITKISSFDTSSTPCKIAGEIDKSQINNLNIPKPQEIGTNGNRLADFMKLGLTAAVEAIDDSGIQDIQEKEDIGVYMGSGIGGLSNIFDTSARIIANKRVHPIFIPSTIINLLAGHISMQYGFMGPNLALATACTTGTHCIGEATRIIRNGEAKIMVAGSAESSVSEIGIKGFSALSALTIKFNDNPKQSSRPWDKNRSGFVMSEGSGVLILEEYEHAKNRGAKIYGEILGYGCSADAHHITSPHPKGAEICIKKAIKNADIDYSKIDYINAHSTSTILGDQSELDVVQKIFHNSKNLAMSSTKGALGHMLGAAGSVELALCFLAMQNNICPPTINLSDPIESKINLIPNTAIQKNLTYVLSNSFGFGGTNASIVIGKV